MEEIQVDNIFVRYPVKAQFCSCRDLHQISFMDKIPIGIGWGEHGEGTAKIRSVGNISINCFHHLLTILPWKVLMLKDIKNTFKRKNYFDSFSWVMILPRLAQ